MRRLAPLLALAIAAPLLSGCIGLAATGIGAAALMADDRRTAGMYLEDENIEWKAIAKFAGSFKGSHVNATSFNRKVLLTGEVSTEDTKKAVEEAIKSIPSVREVTNEIVDRRQFLDHVPRQRFDHHLQREGAHGGQRRSSRPTT